jgi:hypothetical protein
VAGLRPIRSGLVDSHQRYAAVDIAGVDPAGAPVSVDLDRFNSPVLLSFLATACDGCDGFWNGYRDGKRLLTHSVIVTRGPGSTSSEAVAEAARGIADVAVVMSDGAWDDYRVTGYPFFVLVEPRERVVIGETVGFGWAEVLDMINSAESPPS